MSEALVPAAAEPVVVTDRGADVVLPALIVDAGPDAVARFLEFFAGRIANPRTRAAYGRAVGQFLAWCEARGLDLEAVSPLHVAAYIRTHPGSVPTVKQHLAAIRVLCDWLVVSQVLRVNPAAAVRGPKHVVTKGATTVLTPAEARKLLEHIDTGTLAGLRDRALFSVMLYSFARVSAVLGMRMQDYFQQGALGWLRLHEKGGKRHDPGAGSKSAGGTGSPSAPSPVIEVPDPPADTLSVAQLEQYLWSAADILRGSIDSSDYKTYIFGLLFLKRLSDRFEEEAEKLVADGVSADVAWTDPDEHQFFVPDRARWGAILFGHDAHLFLTEPRRSPRRRRSPAPGGRLGGHPRA